MNVSFGPLLMRHSQGSRNCHLGGQKASVPIPHCLYLLDSLTSAFSTLNAISKKNMLTYMFFIMRVRGNI